MKVDAELIRSLRKARSWSQEELAVAASLNLRTVQRVERDGVASLQSKKALALAFDLDANALTLKEKAVEYQYKVMAFGVKGVMGKRIDDRDMEAELNRLGAEGWELIQVVPVLESMGQTAQLVATLKKAAG